MKKFRLFSLLFALAALSVSFTACSDDDPEPQPDPKKAPTVTLTAGVATVDSYDFTVATTDAETVKYAYNKKGEAVPTVDQVLSDGKAVEGQKVTLSGLDGDTEYWVVAAAKGEGGKTLSDVLEFKTLAPEEVAVAVVYKEDSATDHSLSFTITPTNATKVRYHYVVKGDELPAAEKVLENGSTAAADAASDVELNGLNAETTYVIFVVAEGASGVVTATAEGTTLKGEVIGPEPIVFEAVSASASVSDFGADGVNFWTTLTDANGVQCMLDFFAAPGEIYLPTGEYELGDKVPGVSLGRLQYADYSMKGFASGMAYVEAIVENDVLTYAIELDFELADGTPVIGGYEGAIEGISLGSSDAVQLTLESARRIEPNGEVPGEYYISLSGGSAPYTEMSLDFFADPAATNNGNAALPAGTYTVSADQTPGSVKVNIQTWSPSFSDAIASGEVTVSVEGDVYTFDIKLVGADADATKMEGVYTGRVADMVREAAGSEYEEVVFMFTQVTWAGVEKPADDVPFAEFFLFNDDMSQVAQFRAYHPSFATDENPYLANGLWPVIDANTASKPEYYLKGSFQVDGERYTCEPSDNDYTYFGIESGMPSQDNNMISFRLRAVSESGKKIEGSGGYNGAVYGGGDEPEELDPYRMEYFKNKSFTLTQEGNWYTLECKGQTPMKFVVYSETGDIAPALEDPNQPIGAPATYSVEDNTVDKEKSYILQFVEFDEEKIMFESGHFVIQRTNVANQYYLDFGIAAKDSTMTSKYYRNDKLVGIMPLYGRFIINVSRQ